MEIDVLTVRSRPNTSMLGEIMGDAFFFFTIRRPVCSMFIDMRRRLQPQAFEISINAVDGDTIQ